MTDADRYEIAAHKMQTGVAFRMNYSGECEPKHLRVGVNSAMVNNCAMARLLITKGIITEKEYMKEVADEMEREAERYNELLKAQHGGANITLH